MAAQKLTATKVEKHKPTRDDEVLSDGNGLSIRFRRSRTGGLSRTWMHTYKVGTRSVYITLGEHGSALSEQDIACYRLDANSKLTLESARRMAVEIGSWRKRGLDPKDVLSSEAARRELESQSQAVEAASRASQEAIESLTVKAMFDAWLLDGVRRKDGNAELRRSFAADVLPKIGAIAIKDLTEHEVRAVLRAMVDRGVNRAAVMVRNSLTQMFAWAGKRQPWRKLLANGDPMDLIEIERIVSPDYDLDNQRDRVLSPAEIREMQDTFDRMQMEFDAAPDRRATARPVELPTRCAIWIMLSTMCRVGELSMARWEHVDLDAAEWFIPKANVKDNVADLTVYLSPFALSQFRSLRETTGYSDWCFPGRSGERHLDVKSIAKQIGDRQAMFKKSKDGSTRKPMANRRHDNTLVLGGGKNGAWTPHDLRRTGATMMQSLGISLELIDRCQNHVLAGSKVRRHYLHHDYADEKREAWQKLGERLSEFFGTSAMLGRG